MPSSYDPYAYEPDYEEPNYDYSNPLDNYFDKYTNEDDEDYEDDE